MCIDIDGGKTHQYKERKHGEKEALTSSMGCQKHDHSGHPHMTTGEGCCRTFTGIMGDIQQMME